LYRWPPASVKFRHGLNFGLNGANSQNAFSRQIAAALPTSGIVGTSLHQTPRGRNQILLEINLDVKFPQKKKKDFVFAARLTD
jgi:hypothetical protein